MSYGIKVWDSSGSLVIDTSTRITRLITTFAITAGNTGSTTISDFDSNKGFYFCVPQVPSNIGDEFKNNNPSETLLPHKLTWNNSTKVMSWSGSGTGYVSTYGPSFIIVGMYK